MNPIIQFDDKAHKYLERKPIAVIILDVRVIEEPCVQIYTPVVLENHSSAIGMADCAEIVHSLKNVPQIFATPAFQLHFRLPYEVHFTVEGLIKKSITLSNIQPIITKACKI